MADLLGDPSALAEYQFRAALESCGPCRDYHALWPYRRLAGMVHDPDVDGHLIAPLLHAHAPTGGRVLIAGSADAGLLALAHKATSDLKAAIEVTDRCETPLAVCRHYAEMHGFSVSTLLQDLFDQEPSHQYDVAVTHSILRFATEPRRVTFIKRLAERMTRGGTLIFADRLQNSARETKGPGTYAEEMVRALTNRHVPLPEDEGLFRCRLEESLKDRGAHLSSALGPDDLAAYLAQAGLELRASNNHIVRRTAAARAGRAPDITVQIAVATRA
jgi:hypothetical protein